jgi:DNA-binding NarL/FixJ family response regulator
MPIRILIADDTRLTRQHIRAFLQGVAEWDVCGEAIDGLDAIAKAREPAPDVIVLDLAMPRMNGLDAAREIRKVAPRIPILMYTTIGIRGAADKTDAGGSLVGGIRALLRNETFFPCSPTDLSVTGHEQNSGWESGSDTRDLERSRVRRSPPFTRLGRAKTSRSSPWSFSMA